MAHHSQTTIAYFRAYQDYFWRWADQGNVIEFSNQRTICYREDLNNILKVLPQSTSLSLGTILLILCACKPDWEKHYDAWATLINIQPSDFNPTERPLTHNLSLKRQAHEFLTIISNLPAEYRSDVKRAALLQTVFDSLNDKGYHMGLLPLLNEFNSGEMDEEIFGTAIPLTEGIIIQDFAPLAGALAIFKDVASLEMKLKTGVIEVPGPVSLPQVDSVYNSLLDELEDDSETETISRLAKRIIAALNIPMHLSGSSEQSLGGISDIANKGTYDKLLLSELAQDDLLLTARLANNEALFLKRETSPNPKTQELGIIIDSTLKMWGSARVFAVATGLAFRESKQQHQQLKVWALGGEKVDVQQLETKKDAIALLEKMDTALHCGKMLQSTLQQDVEKDGRYVFITSDHFLKDAASAPYFLKNRDKLQYLITLSAAGHLRMMQLNNKQTKLIREAHIDLNDLGKERRQSKKHFLPSSLPAVFQESRFPMYYPTSKIKLSHFDLCVLKNQSVIAVSIDLRLLYWPARGKGAVELVTQVEKGWYCFGEIENDVFLMVISENKGQIKIYNINLQKVSYTVLDVETLSLNPNQYKFISPYFYLEKGKQLHKIDPYTGKTTQAEEDDQKLFKETSHKVEFFQNELKKRLNNGYSAINSSKKIYLGKNGQLFSDQKEFLLVDNQFYWKTNLANKPDTEKQVSNQIIKVDELAAIRFTQFSWKNGSTALMDSRGLLHLKSHNPAVTEVCIIMIIDLPTACWSADGYVSGSGYFTGFDGFGQANQLGENIGNTVNGYLEPDHFYIRYIQPFIDNLPLR